MGSYHWDLKKRQAPVNDITTDVRQDLDVDAKKVVLVEGDEHMESAVSLATTPVVPPSNVIIMCCQVLATKVLPATSMILSYTVP